MKRTFAVLLGCCIAGLAAAQDPSPADESQLIGVLQSGTSSAREKATACASLKRVVTARSVPALAALLTDNDLSHSARYVLESLPGPEAENGLLNALPQTSGSNQVGIINSLAKRRDPAAVGALSKLLGNSDSAVVIAAAEGLGHIGGPKSLKSLEHALPSGTGAVHEAEIDSLLACANRLLANGDNSAALKIFRQLYDHEKSDGIALASYRGIILASGSRGIPLMMKAIASGDSPTQGAALELALRMPGPAVTAQLAGLLANAPVPVQISLLQCLGQRGDPSVSAPVAQLVASADPAVREAAITALGDLGDQSVAVVLAKCAASSTGAERTAARQSLDDLRHGPVTQTLMAALSDDSPKVRLEIIRALGDRGDASVAPTILQLARANDDAISSASFQALGTLGGAEQVPDLLQIVVQTTSDDRRSGAAGALGSISQRLESQGAQWDVQSLVSAVKTGPVQTRLALLPICSGLTDASVRDALRASMADPNPGVREAAIDALCDTHDSELLPDMLKVACSDPEKRFRTVAIGGCVRLAVREEAVKLPAERKIEIFKTILDTPLNTAQKRLVLSGLEAVPNDQSLALVTPMLDDNSVRSEAAQAVIHIAGSISKSQSEEAGAALKKVLAMSLNSATRKSAEKAYQRFQ
jgi:HEAT repeat protein